MPTINEHWGDPMLTPKPLHTFCIISWNVITLSTKQNYLQWKAASTASMACKANAVALQEANISWNKIH